MSYKQPSDLTHCRVVAAQCSLTVCVVTTVAGTWRTVAVAVPSVRGEHDTPEATGIPLAPVTMLAAMVTVVPHVETEMGLPPEVVVIVIV